MKSSTLYINVHPISTVSVCRCVDTHIQYIYSFKYPRSVTSVADHSDTVTPFWSNLLTNTTGRKNTFVPLRLNNHLRKIMTTRLHAKEPLSGSSWANIHNTHWFNLAVPGAGWAYDEVKSKPLDSYLAFSHLLYLPIFNYSSWKYNLRVQKSLLALPRSTNFTRQLWSFLCRLFCRLLAMLLRTALTKIYVTSLN